MEFTKTEIVLFSIACMLIVAIGAQRYAQTGCLTTCSPQVSAGIEINPYNQFHQIPEPSAALLVGVGVGILIKMRA